ncbi:unnamed protein product [Brassica napus]|uniref:(rape) hypothetical protein n=1 Tax=Brassica napus TaxID=3708 RepID=A0A816PA38_BRANA|nr:unnamed protein product [Brassica napus]
MCTNERGARDIWTLIFLLTTTWRNRMPAIYCSDLPYDSWVWGPHSGGWLAGWCLNMEHNCGLSWSCSSICMRWALNHTWRLVTGLKIFAILIRK